MRILNFGSCNIDYVYSLDHVASIGETETTTSLNIFPGGKGLNQSIAITRAGNNVYHAGCIGDGGELLLDILKANDVDISFIERVNIQKALAYFREKFPNLKVMLTLGNKGCIYQDEKEQRFFPIFKVDAIDTTGAGDTFTGYFVGGIANGNKIEKILELASCASAISVTREGAAPSIPYMEEVMGRINCLETNTADMKAEMLRIKIEEYVEENLRNAALNGLADFLGYSTAYTGALVKKITNETYKKFLQKKRLEVSATLLLQTDLSIDQIIKTVGYDSASFFRRKFNEKYGITPLNYRKRRVK